MVLLIEKAEAREEGCLGGSAELSAGTGVVGLAVAPHSIRRCA